MIKPDTLNTKTDVTGELVFQPIDTGLDTITTQSDIPEEIMAPETLQSGSFQKGMTVYYRITSYQNPVFFS